MEHPPL